MRNLLAKEFRLSAFKLTYFFILFACMTFLPGYPILMGCFFICLGLFFTFQMARESNDVLYSALLPIEKGDVVKARFLFVCIIQMAGFLLMVVFTWLRMSLLNGREPWASNVLMAANPLFLAFALLVFLLFNAVFVRGFYKTAYYYGRPFVWFIVTSFLVILAAETLHFLPGLAFLNASAGPLMWVQYLALACALVLFAGGSCLAYRSARKSFEGLDL